MQGKDVGRPPVKGAKLEAALYRRQETEPGGYLRSGTSEREMKAPISLHLDWSQRQGWESGLHRMSFHNGTPEPNFASMKLQLTPLITNAQAKATAAGLTASQYYELMTHPTAAREAEYDRLTATLVTTGTTAYFSL